MVRRLRIAYVVDSAGSARAGGLVAAERMIQSLRRHHDVISVGLGGDVDLEQFHFPVGRELIESNSFAFAKPDTDLLYRAFDGVDVVHVQLPFFLGFAAIAVAQELRIPVVAAHHVQPENILRGISLIAPRFAALINRPGVARALNKMVTQTFFNRASAIICPSQLALDELVTAGLTAPAVVISNGAPAQFAPLPSRPPGPFTVLTVGRLVPEKRHDLLVEAVRRSKHAAKVRLVIAGRGPLQEKLEQQAKSLPLGAELGFKSDQELLRLYQTADLYVHASEVELEGMAVLEAMRCGCPTLTSDSRTSATKQFALDADHVFPTGDVQALTNRLDDWFEHPERQAREREKTLAAVEGFGIEHTLLAYESVYERVVAQR
ncbi:MAG: glycosyltransferase [Archangium sp.]|nr:glycosyltransferase [Archangium sp.]MDP3154547.1 glycosyltransferase [Archangium sp.]MDP3569414.1 glycosyltransferase [Archangium sp.]